jgi:hypothetical protein
MTITHVVERNAKGHLEQTTTKYRKRLDELFPHPFNVKVYGEEPPSKDLIASLETVGQLEAILVCRIGRSRSAHQPYGTYTIENDPVRYYILAGHQRYRAAKQLGWKKVDVRCIRGDNPTPLEIEQIIIEANRQRVKTAEQKAREFKELKRIEAALAEARMKSGKKANPKENFPQGGGCPSGKTRYASIEALQEAEKPSNPIRVYHCRKCDGYHCDKRQDQARDKAAAAIGLSGKTAEKLEKLVDAKDAGDSKAAAALADIDAKKGRGVDSAYRAVVPPSASKRDLQADIEKASELSAYLKEHGVDAVVNHMKKAEGCFGVTLRGLTESQVRQLPNLLASLSNHKAAA